MRRRYCATWGPKEVGRSALAMASSEQRHQLADGTGDAEVRRCNRRTDFVLGMDPDEYIRNMPTSALGADKASGIIDRILLGRNSKGLNNQMDGPARDCRTDPARTSSDHRDRDVVPRSRSGRRRIVRIPDRVRTDVIMRVATLDGIQPAALQELDEILEKQFSGGSNVKSSALGGVEGGRYPELRRWRDREQGDRTDQRGRRGAVAGDPGQHVRFENLIDVDDRGMQTLLREVSTISRCWR